MTNKHEWMKIEYLSEAIFIGMNLHDEIREKLLLPAYQEGFERAANDLELHIKANIQVERFKAIAIALFNVHVMLYREAMDLWIKGMGKYKYEYEDGYSDLLYCMLEYMSAFLQENTTGENNGEK